MYLKQLYMNMILYNTLILNKLFIGVTNVCCIFVFCIWHLATGSQKIIQWA